MKELVVLDAFPEINEFYAKYWGKVPFVVRGAIEQACFDDYIDGDNLAGLALEEGVRARLVMSEADNVWSCQYAPLEEEVFATLEERRWSLLVQNVEQYHPPTAQLLQAFDFSPRWLMDDIMVSYSSVGGSVGPHMDSYHVFLVQGQGKRKWQIGHTPIHNPTYAENKDVLVLKDGFDGEWVEVSMGDVVYIPPYFGHQGVTLEEAMTFSVGFLGPQLSEIFAEYSHYLEQMPSQNIRYIGEGVDAKSAGFSIDSHVVQNVQNVLMAAIAEDGFAAWMAEYFSTVTHDALCDEEDEEAVIAEEEMRALLEDGQLLCRPEQMKIVVTQAMDGAVNLAAKGELFVVEKSHVTLIDWLQEGTKISLENIVAQENNPQLMALLVELYEKEIVVFVEG